MSSEASHGAPRVGGDERPPRTILVVEDSDDFRLVLAAFLGGRGYEVVEAKSGGEAVEAARGRRLDLVLTDLGLPEMEPQRSDVSGQGGIRWSWARRRFSWWRTTRTSGSF